MLPEHGAFPHAWQSPGSGAGRPTDTGLTGRRARSAVGARRRRYSAAVTVTVAVMFQRIPSGTDDGVTIAR